VISRRNHRTGQAYDPGELYLGLIDAVLTIAVTLANKGILERDELAAVFDETARQHTQEGASDSRRVAVEYIGKFFQLAVRGDRRFRVIDGGGG
jgi:hypothetical protein